MDFGLYAMKRWSVCGNTDVYLACAIFRITATRYTLCNVVWKLELRLQNRTAKNCWPKKGGKRVTVPRHVTFMIRNLLAPNGLQILTDTLLQYLKYVTFRPRFRNSLCISRLMAKSHGICLGWNVCMTACRTSAHCAYRTTFSAESFCN